MTVSWSSHAKGQRAAILLCNPYRIVYEAVGDQVRILAIMHSRMLVWSSDTRWT